MGMFDGCTSLKSLKCLATEDITFVNENTGRKYMTGTEGWLSNVKSWSMTNEQKNDFTITFKDGTQSEWQMDSSVSVVSGYYNGWTVRYE